MKLQRQHRPSRYAILTATLVSGLALPAFADNVSVVDGTVNLHAGISLLDPAQNVQHTNASPPENSSAQFELHYEGGGTSAPPHSQPFELQDWAFASIAVSRGSTSQHLSGVLYGLVTASASGPGLPALRVNDIGNGAGAKVQVAFEVQDTASSALRYTYVSANSNSTGGLLDRESGLIPVLPGEGELATYQGSATAGSQEHNSETGSVALFFSFYPGSTTSAGLGDIDTSGTIDAMDIQLVANAVLGETGGQSSSLFDLNGDSSVTIADHTYLYTNIRGTVKGDTDLDGDVDSIDLTTFAQHYSSGTGFGPWQWGDFDGDWSIDFADYLALSQNYGYGTGGRPGPSLTSADFAADWAFATGVTPEPASLATLAGLAVLALRRVRG